MTDKLVVWQGQYIYLSFIYGKCNFFILSLPLLVVIDSEIMTV